MLTTAQKLQNQSENSLMPVLAPEMGLFGHQKVDVVDSELLVINPEESRSVRLSPIRAKLEYDELNGATLLNYAERAYLEWVQTPEYIILGKYNFLEGYEEFVGVKASKRGNDVYAKRVKNRFSPLMDLPDVRYFSHKDRSKRHKTGCIFVTLTYNPSNYSIGEAWERVGEDYNRFISAFRGAYGSCSVVRVWEAQKNGYPHVHAVIVCENAPFNAFHHNGAWRITEKRDIEEYWSHGFSDIEALGSTKGGLTYVAKYLGKLHGLGHGASTEVNEGLEYGGFGSNMGKLIGKASLRTLSLMWIYRKRAFAVSGGFSDLIRAMHNSNEEEAYEVLLQLNLHGGAPPEAISQWVLCGFFVGELIKGGRVRWATGITPVQFAEIRSSGAFISRMG